MLPVGRLSKCFQSIGKVKNRESFRTMKLKPSVVINDSGFVFNPETGDSFVLNSVGLEIVYLMKGGGDMDTLNKHLIKKFDVKSSLLNKDLEDFFWILRNHKLLSDVE